MNALCAILHQLICRNPPLTRHVANAFRYRGARSLSQFNTLWDILVETALDQRAGPIICIIDGIDECLEQERPAFLNRLSGFLCSKDAEQSCLRFILTSRPYVSIERELSKMPQTEQIHIHAEDEPIHVRRDIERIINFRINELGYLKSISHQSLDKLANHLSYYAGTNFLWVTLVLDLIEESPRVSDKHIQKILSNSPDKLDDIYEQILSRSPDPAEAKRLLHMIAGATRPLTLRELNVALSISEEDTSASDIALEPSIKNTVRELCGLFLHIAHETVYFVHQTAFDFIVGRKANAGCKLRDDGEDASTHGDWKHCVNLKVADSMLARICIQVIGFPEWRDLTTVDDDADDKSSSSISSSSSMLYNEPPPPRERLRFVSDDPILAFLAYSAGSWFRHFETAELADSPQIAHDAVAVCEPSGPFFKYWSLFLDEGGLHEYWSPKDMGTYKPTALCTMVWVGLASLIPLYLKTSDHDLSSLIPFKGETLLHYTIREGEEDTSLALINSGAELDIQDLDGNTPLHLACLERQEMLVRRLLEQGAPVDVRNDKGYTPLFLAVGGWNEKDKKKVSFPIADLLLQFGSNPNNSFKNAIYGDETHGMPSLFIAVHRGNHKLARLLLEKGAVVSAPHFVCTALHMLKPEGDREMIEMLLFFRPDAINIQSKYGKTPLFYWGQLGGPNFHILLEYGADPNITPENEISILNFRIFQAYYEWEQLEGSKKQLEHVLFDMRQDHAIAVQNRDSDRVFFLERGMRAEAWKVFHSEKVDDVKKLTNAGADPNFCLNSNTRGNTCLVAAVANRDVEVVQILLEAGADPNVHPRSQGLNGPPLTIVAAQNPPDARIAQLLLEYGADPNYVGGTFGSPLVAAAMYGEQDIARLLIYHGADVDIHVGAPHGTPLIAASMRNFGGMVSLLLANGADPMRTAVTIDGRIFWPYGVAEDHSARAVMQALMWNGARIDPAAGFEFHNEFKAEPEVEEYDEYHEQHHTLGLTTDDEMDLCIPIHGDRREYWKLGTGSILTASQRAHAASQGSRPHRASRQTNPPTQQTVNYQLRLTWPGD